MRQREKADAESRHEIATSGEASVEGVGLPLVDILLSRHSGSRGAGLGGVESGGATLVKSGRGLVFGAALNKMTCIMKRGRMAQD